ncbi:MAG TPA: anti-sigma factor [Polyangiaceae bacterium]
MRRRSESSDPRVRELLLERALHGLDESQTAELRRLGGEDDDSFDQAAAAVELATLRGKATGALPASLAEKILAASPAGGGKRAPVARLDRATPAWMAAAACLLLAAAGWWWGMRQRGEVRVVVAPPPPAGSNVAPAPSSRPPSPAQEREALIAEAKDVTRVEWHGTKDPAGHAASGDVVWSNAEQRGYMRFQGLEANDRAKAQYQLWIFDATRDAKYPIDGGVFDVPAGGEVVVPIAAKLKVETPTLFAVTLEKPGGVVVSKRERIVVTASVGG